MINDYLNWVFFLRYVRADQQHPAAARCRFDICTGQTRFINACHGWLLKIVMAIVRACWCALAAIKTFISLVKESRLNTTIHASQFNKHNDAWMNYLP